MVLAELEFEASRPYCRGKTGMVRMAFILEKAQSAIGSRELISKSPETAILETANLLPSDSRKTTYMELWKQDILARITLPCLACHLVSAVRRQQK